MATTNWIVLAVWRSVFFCSEFLEKANNSNQISYYDKENKPVQFAGKFWTEEENK